MTRNIVLAMLLVATVAHAGPQSVLVKFSSPSARGAMYQFSATHTRTFDFIGVEQWEVAGSPRDVAERLSAMPGVEYATPDAILTLTATTPNDPNFPSQWHLNATGQNGECVDCDIDAPEAWDIFTGTQDVIVATIDTGVPINANGHPDLNANLWKNVNEIPDNGIDDDGNGYIDDYHGWDFGGDGVVQDNLPNDHNGHGTGVAGIIGARGNNGIGVSGVNWQVRIMPLKFTIGGQGFGYLSSAIGALNYARMMGAKITNNSYSTTTPDQSLQAAIAACTAAGMLTVCAAANSGANVDCCPPSCGAWPMQFPDEGIISVGGSSYQDGVLSFSNYGHISVDLFASGTGVYTTHLFEGYGTWSGTSFSTPQVAGAAALLWGYQPTLTAGQVKQRILESVDIKPAFYGKCATNGRLNIHRMLTQGGGGGGEQETQSDPAPVKAVPAGPAKAYDVQGRRVDESRERSGVTFKNGKRVTVR